MKTTICTLIAAALLTACASGPSGSRPLVTLNSFDNTENGSGTMENDGSITIKKNGKVYKGKPSDINDKKPVVKNNPAVKYKRGSGNGTAILKSGSDSINCEFNLDEDIAMGYCKDSAGKEYDLYAK
jgi:hypothetical protein